jgi:predicted lipoprotein with Yx(FWY)xxD motif
VSTTPVRTPLTAAAAGLAALLFMTACGEGASGDSTGGTSAGATSPTTAASTAESRPTISVSPSEAADGTTITTGNSDFGVMLFDEVDQAIYLFDKETAGEPACSGDCADDWPPVLTSGTAQATGDVRPDLLGTVARDDGSVQVTYAGHPLYYYAHEEPGQVLCHNVVDYGGTWLVVTPAGTPAP